MSDNTDVVVVGAGVIGIAVARELALSGHAVVLLEQHHQFGSETSSRNSEVIHAGLYYPPGSLKATLCVQGRELLYHYAARQSVDHQRVGKLIVASEEQELPRLRQLAQNARNNGVKDLQWLDATQLKQREPEVRGIAALFSPSTGIIDSHGLMFSLMTDFEQAAGTYVHSSGVAGIRRADKQLAVRLRDEPDYQLHARLVVNAGGLGAWALARSCPDLAASHIPPQFFAIGRYYTMSGATPFKHLIYPLPASGGLGIHATLDLAGQVRFGPDVKPVDEVNYHFDDDNREDFYQAIARYYPPVRERELMPAYTGIRPKVVPPQATPADFVIHTPADHGVPGLINLYGIESPGLTASLAVGRYVATLAEKTLMAA